MVTKILLKTIFWGFSWGLVGILEGFLAFLFLIEKTYTEIE